MSAAEPADREGVVRVLDSAEQDFIRELAQSPDDQSKHAAFIYGILREPLFDTALMSSAMAATPLTADAMIYIAERWKP